MLKTELRIDSRDRRVLDLTDEVLSFLSDTDGDGLLNIFAPHATVGLALIETGAGSEADLEELIERLVPRDDRYVHRHGSIGHGGDHLLPALIAPSLVIPVVAGRAELGTWQRIVLVDPNRENNARTVRLSFLSG